MNIIIKPSSNRLKKFDAIIDDKKKISFGQKGASDFTINKDIERKNRYLDRHKKDNYNNPLYPSFYSTNLLWNKQSLNESIKDTNRRFKNIEIKLKRI
jgi:hypothetical protein